MTPTKRRIAALAAVRAPRNGGAVSVAAARSNSSGQYHTVTNVAGQTWDQIAAADSWPALAGSGTDSTLNTRGDHWQLGLAGQRQHQRLPDPAVPLRSADPLVCGPHHTDHDDHDPSGDDDDCAGRDYDDRLAGDHDHHRRPPRRGPAATTTTVAPPTGRFVALPVGAALPSEANCASRVRRMTENGPGNVTPKYATLLTNSNDENPRVTGNFVGTTDEIIQWARRASGGSTRTGHGRRPRSSRTGSSPSSGTTGGSFGLLQVRRPCHGSAFEDENTVRSTAYNADYAWSVWRRCFEGEFTWLNSVERGAEYGPGDQLGCFGVHFAGRYRTAPALGYMNTLTNTYYTPKVWTQASFPPAVPR